MIVARPPIGGRAANASMSRALRLGLTAVVIALVTLTGAAAKEGPTAAPASPPPAQVRALINLLADPAVQKWLERAGAAEAAERPAIAEKPQRVTEFFASDLGRMRQHITEIVAAFSTLPAAFSEAVLGLEAEAEGGGSFPIGRLLAGFVALGFGAELLFRLGTRRVRRHLDALPVASQAQRMRVIAERFGLAAGLVLAFAVGSIGAFLAVDWPPLLRDIVSGYLMAFVAIRVAVVIGQFVLAPRHGRFCIVPMEASAARFWCWRLYAFVGWFALGSVTVELLATLGFSAPERDLIAYALGLGLLAVALEAIWRHPAAPATAPAEDPAGETDHLGRGTQNILLTVGAVLLWVLWVARAMPSFWLLLLVITLPLAIAVSRRAVDHLLRPAGATPVDKAVPSVLAVCIERGVRALLLIGAVALLAWGWGVPLSALSSQDTGWSRFVRGALSAVIILLVADVLWQAAKAAIDRKLAESADAGLLNGDEARRRARVRTLLPIFRHVLFFLVIAIAAMMALATIGVQIGPLIAGAGVIGVAVGFGSQTLVRDIIAGMFYLLDDAFRVGEYIQSGNYKGTVEGFSLRSIKLRHHRGPLYTVPFGLLGAIQNQSRDWVIDKITIGVTYDSDIDLAKKLIKQIGLDLGKNPDFAPLIIEPLKMQGVDALGDFAVQLRAKMMTLPGEQFAIRRQAYSMIKKAFDANGIKFAYPTVQVAGGADGEPATAAVSQQALELTRRQAAE
jgi:moderate conductance mechanosensitive channel